MKKLCIAFLIAFALLCGTAQAQITHVASYTGGAFSGGVSQITITNCNVDDYIVVGAGWGFTDTVTLTSVTDADGTYTVAQNLADPGTGRTITAYHKCTSSGSHTVSVTASTDPAFSRVYAHVVRGVDTANPLDASNARNTSGSTTTDSAATVAITPANNGSYLFSFGFDLGGNGFTFTAGTDFTKAPSPGSSDSGAEYYIQPTAASHIGSFTLSGTSFSVGMHLLVFKPAAGGGGGSSPKKITLLGVGGE